MQAQTTFRSRPFGGEQDLQPICDLLNLCNDVDGLGEPFITPEDWRVRLQAPRLDVPRDVRLWEDSSGVLVAYGQVGANAPDDGSGLVDGHFLFRVRHEARGAGLEDEMIQWASERLREMGRERGVPVQIQAGLHEALPEYIAYRKGVLESNGFKPVRYWFDMARDLHEPIPEPQLPEGFTLRHTQGAAEAGPWVDMFNESFIDHWNHHDEKAEEHAHWLRTNPKYKPERDLVAIAPDGTFAAFCFCMINPDDNKHKQRNEGWIDILGTRRGFRKIGLGRAMLLAGLHRLKADGMDTALLGVDADNLTGALRLYESVGFKKILSTSTWRKEL